MIWHKEINLEGLNKFCEDTLVSHLEIKFIEFDNESITASMPVKNSVKQPFGIVHGGANCVLAETVGSVAANLSCGEDSHAVGQSIHTTHLKAVRNGEVKCIGKPIRLGKSNQVWELVTYDSSGDKTSFSTLTMAIRKRLS